MKTLQYLAARLGKPMSYFLEETGSAFSQTGGYGIRPAAL